MLRSIAFPITFVFAALVLALGGDIVGLETVRGGPALLESEYDRLFVTTLPGNKLPVHTLELRYGE